MSVKKAVISHLSAVLLLGNNMVAADNLTNMQEAMIWSIERAEIRASAITRGVPMVESDLPKVVITPDGIAQYPAQAVIHASAFQPDRHFADDGANYYFNISEGFLEGVASVSCMMAPITLPPGLAIRSLNVILEDLNSGGALTIALYRSPNYSAGVTDATAQIVGLASDVAGTTGGLVNYSATLSTAEPVDNSSYLYYMGLCLADDVKFFSAAVNLE